ncbi:S-adenosyl-L-methionine-dependent methyltransferase [Cladochytrium replicatum]|nr:S-adenosyl-L-methionine-dependent methyltransferase [Cladochytrium replicatum]
MGDRDLFHSDLQKEIPTVNAEAAAAWAVPEPTHGSNADGRRYHSEKNAPYVLPDDVKEGARLNLQHHLLRQLWGGPNYAGVTEAELQRGLKVLDSGCGSGIWLAEMQRDFPNGEYYGSDISTTEFAQNFQSLTSNKIVLNEGNVLERLPYDDNTFDYVHQQMLIIAIPEQQWPAAIAELCRVLKPGGVLDLVELDPMPQHHGTPAKIQNDRNDLGAGMFKARGIDLHISAKLASLARETGLFEKVDEEGKKANFGWGGEIGVLWKENMKKAQANIAAFATAALGITAEEWEAGDKALDVEDERSRAYLPCYRVTAWKRQE